MKKLMISCALLFGAMSLHAEDIKEMVVTTTPQISCQNCENKIKGNLRFEKGVKKVETSLKDQTVTVIYDADKTDEAKLSAALEKLNYKVEKVDGKAHHDGICQKKCEESQKKCEGNGSCCQNDKR